MTQSKMTPYLSDKIRVLSFLCILLVVWIHTYYTEGQGYTSSILLMNAWGCGVCTLAVPLFYSISGYLFFLGTMEKDFQSVFVKQKKRVRTLLVPYILTNIISMLFYFGLRLFTQMKPEIGGLVNNNLLDRAQDGLWGTLKYCFWDGPIAFQLWFVRDLLMLVVIAPIIYYIIRHIANVKWLGYLGILLCVLLINWHASPFLWASGWFILGGILSTNVEICIADTKRYLWLGAVLAIGAISVIIIDALYAAHLTNLFLDMDIITICGVPAVWILYDVVAKGRCFSQGKIMTVLCGSTFFVYLIHEPFLNIFKKVPFAVSRSEMIINLSYVLCPLLFVASAVVFGLLFKKLAPKTYGIFTGRR